MIAKIRDFYKITYGKETKFYNFNGIIAILNAGHVSNQNLGAVMELLSTRVYGEITYQENGKTLRATKQPLGNDWCSAISDLAEAGWNVKRVKENDLKQIEMTI